MTQSSPAKKIYDCFIFYNELDLLKIRLHELYEHVDYFVICEADVTFQGQPKPLVFAENREMFSAFADKIIHLVVDDMPTDCDVWDREHFQRNALRRALINLDPNDVVIITDTDEIIRPSTIKYFRENGGYFLLQMEMYQFYMNMYAAEWYRPFAYSWFLDAKVGDYNDARNGEFETLKRFLRQDHAIAHALWHFTFLGGADRVRNKLQAYSHTERWQQVMQQPGAAEHQMSLLMNVGGGQLLTYREVDESFPRYVQENRSALIEAGLVKGREARMRELEHELAHFILLKRQGDNRERYKDAELDRWRAAGLEMNLALDKPARQSSVPEWLSGGSLDDARNANNGSIPVPGQWAFHTEYEQDPWWQVDLEVECDVSEVVIFNRQEYPGRLAHFSLLKSFDGENWVVIFQKTDDEVFEAEPYVVRFEAPEPMRFLRVRLDGEDYLHFTQCMVYGRPRRPLPMGTIAVGRKPDL